ncbi:MAG TPA: hypothetical protein VLA28_03875, partial [Afifellaceae bacterium]|nr:hypothetical protein [Afifellaceae bacterium]
EFLSLRMYPAKLVNQARVEVGEGKSREDAEAYIEKVEIYERALRALSDETLVALVEDERQQDAALLQEQEEQLDRHRFFNDPKASANFPRWAKRPCWSLDETTALILGKSPEVVDWAHIEPLIGVSPFAARFSDIRRHLTHARNSGQLFDPVEPARFLAWARERGVVLPQVLEGCIDDRRSGAFAVPKTDKGEADGNVSDDGMTDLAWQPERVVPSDHSGETPSDKIICFTREQSRLRVMAERMKAAEERTAAIENDLTGDVTDALLKMTIAMAVGRYGFDPDNGRDSTITDIVRDLEKVGLSLSPATIDKWLREATACLPDRIAEDGKAKHG